MCDDHPTNPSIGPTLYKVAAEFGIELKFPVFSRELCGQEEFMVIRGQSTGRRGREQIRQELGLDRQSEAGFVLVYETPLHSEIRSAKRSPHP